jgi:hypothetical protein
MEKFYNYNLNNPYFTYPGSPFRGYHNFTLYNEELIRLKDFIEYESVPQNCLVHLGIGAAMEEIPSSHNYDSFNQWRQLFPVHIDSFIDNFVDRSVKIIIVSPNITFELKNFKIPEFIKQTNDKYDWIKVNEKLYISNKYNISVNIFCTMMPTEDKRNKTIMNYFVKEELNKEICWIMNLEQTKSDIEFVDQFYEKLSQLFEKVNLKNGIVTCYSFAVFNELTNYNSLNDYKMFKEIVSLFSDSKTNSTKRVLSRWYYDETCQYVVLNCCGKTVKISYVDKNNYKMDLNEIKFIKFNSQSEKLFIDL